MTTTNPRARRLAPAALACLAAAQPALAQTGSGPLAAYFGFDDKRVIVVDDAAGPFVTADFNNDGLTDIAIANDAKSRIELHIQRTSPRTPDELDRDFDVNELPPSVWFDRVEVPVAHVILALVARDLNADGKTDLLYAGRPAEVVALHQTGELEFEIEGRRRIRDLRATQSAFGVADVMGDFNPELITIVGGKVSVYALDERGPVGEPKTLPSDGDIVAFFLDDYDGNTLTDILGVLIESDAPLRLWRQRNTDDDRSNAAVVPGPKNGLIGPEVRFEVPPLIEVEPFRTPDRDAASVAVIERQSGRMVLYDLATEDIEPRRETDLGVAEREAVVELYAFRSGEDRDRAVSIADINADGRPDIVATDAEANSISLRIQRPGVGVADTELFSAFKEPKALATGQWDNDPELEVFVLSEEEEAIGVADYNPDTDRLSFPTPITALTGGATPVAMTAVPLNAGDSALAIVMRERRDHTLEVHFPATSESEPRPPFSIELENVNRPPGSMLPGDFDKDGQPDLILFTPGEPMVMIAGLTTPEPAVLTDKDMANFGLVNAAGPQNTASFDIDNDGETELLIADENFVRAAAFDRDNGWTVVDQITVPDPGSQLTAITTFQGTQGPAIVAADAANDLILVVEPDSNGDWNLADKLRLTAVEVGALHAGRFNESDDTPAILATTPDAFALVRLSGTRVSLDEFAAYRSDDEQRREHEIIAGDINNDGFTDLVVLDDREHAVRIFTLSRSRKLIEATEFTVFEERLFSGGGFGGSEPSWVVIDDVTGDNLDDIIVEVHDRYIVYPQARDN